jgi:hypothetical protein
MAKPGTEREKELIEAFETVLSYVKRVYGVEYDRPIGLIVRRLLACVEEEPIEVGENRLPGKENIEVPLRRCGLCKRIITGTEHTWRDKEWRPHVVCECCFDVLIKKFRENWRGDRSVFK